MAAKHWKINNNNNNNNKTIIKIKIYVYACVYILYYIIFCQKRA